ncbi:hypothetical protein SLEP1_g21254 [Rubroshorea leprosula]|uniref:Cytochrome P450 n=1 Tax=Rubroshorea leprosula TaxID=152421 RepID=A0AAV5J5B6_9ROSI|nr:hypothetical protein SLEP1_g21254 [Rubroshorea leprosula]
MEMSYYGHVRLLTLGLILLSLCLRLGHRKLNLPPGPWPIIGNLNLIGPLPHRSIHALSQEYGPIMQLRFGSFLVVPECDLPLGAGKRYTEETKKEIVTPCEFKKMLGELFLLNGLADDQTLNVKIERHGAKAFAQDLIAGGTGSSSTTIEWAMAELLKRLEIFKKETELHPVAPTLAARMARGDCQIAGYDIRKGTRIFVIVSVWTTGRDPALWGNPEEFCPRGRRMCPGYGLGLKVIQSTLANVLHGFTWKLPGNMREEDLNMEEIFGLTTTRKIPLQVVVEPRLQPHMYAL